MLFWTVQEPAPSKRRKASGKIISGNPINQAKNFIAQCKTQGMTYQEVVIAVEERFGYFPTEAEIIVREFWA